MKQADKMNAQQKQAWLVLGAFSGSVITYLVLLPRLGPENACGAFGLIGVVGLGPLIFKRGKPDERDLAINRKAARLAMALSYLTFVIGCMGTWMIAYWLFGKEKISINTLAAITGAGGIVAFVSHSLSLLLQYHGRMEADCG